MVHGLRVRKTRVRPFMPAVSVMESSEPAWNDSKTAHRILFTRWKRDSLAWLLFFSPSLQARLACLKACKHDPTLSLKRYRNLMFTWKAKLNWYHGCQKFLAPAGRSVPPTQKVGINRQNGQMLIINFAKISDVIWISDLIPSLATVKVTQKDLNFAQLMLQQTGSQALQCRAKPSPIWMISALFALLLLFRPKHAWRAENGFQFCWIGEVAIQQFPCRYQIMEHTQKPFVPGHLFWKLIHFPLPRQIDHAYL